MVKDDVGDRSDINEILTDEFCRNIVGITTPRLPYVISLMVSVTNEREKHMFWLQAMGLIETWLLI